MQRYISNNYFMSWKTNIGAIIMKCLIEKDMVIE